MTVRRQKETKNVKMLLVGFQRVTPGSKSPFTNLYTEYARAGVEGKATESIYVADGFQLPALKVGMTLEVDRDGRGYLISVAEALPQFGSTPPASKG
jgi:hypothetical protein